LDGVGHQFPANGTFTFPDTGATNRSRFQRAAKQQGGLNLCLLSKRPAHENPAAANDRKDAVR
jgi:hypothetical protein